MREQGRGLNVLGLSPSGRISSLGARRFRERPSDRVGQKLVEGRVLPGPRELPGRLTIWTHTGVNIGLYVGLIGMAVP